MPREQFSVEVEITGIEETCRALTSAPEATVPPALLHGLTAGGKVIEEFISGAAPEKTGEMLADLDTAVTLDADFRGGIAESGFSVSIT